MRHLRYALSLLPLLLTSLLTHRRLIWQLAKREVVGRYRGSFGGVLWSLLNPILMLTVYTFFFTVVFPGRWGGAVMGNHYEFAILLFAGLIVYSLFAECFNRAPGLVLAQPSYVKKVIFPLEVLPWVSVLTALFHAAISLAVLLVFALLVYGSLPWTGLLLPLVWAPLLAVALGLSWLLASLGVFVRDINQAMAMITTALMFISPIFYPATALPESIRNYAFLNPLTLPIEQTREVLLFGRLPDFAALGIYSLFAALIAWIGLWWFEKTRHGFADVM